MEHPPTGSSMINNHDPTRLKKVEDGWQKEVWTYQDPWKRGLLISVDDIDGIEIQGRPVDIQCI